MGAAQSVDDVQAHLPNVPDASNDAGDGSKATILYKIMINSSAGTWNVASRNATWRFYDQNENSSNKTAWFLEIEAGDIDTLVAESSEMQTDLEALSATFYEPETACVCKLRFPSRAVCTEFCDEYQNKLYENMSSQGHSEIGNAGDWFFRPADAEPMEWDEAPDAPPAAEEPATPKAWRQSSALNASTPQEVQGMVMGANDNSFVVQQGYIGVVRNEYGGVRGTGQGFAVTPPPRSAGGIGETRQNLTPGKMILAQGETHANLLSPEQNTSVYQMNLEQGKVVRGWATNLNGVEVPMSDIATDTKAAQLDERPTFLGLDKNRLAKWDNRVKAGMVQDLSSPATLNYVGGKDYARGTNFTCMATSGDGYIAVGSKDGRIRLYGSKHGMESYEFKQAATSVPGLGLPITSIDVTYDSRYVVATTDKYLVVLQTFFKDAKGHDTNGFVSRMGSKTPPPKLLRLTAEDRVKVGPKAVLSKAKLTWITEDNMTERWIVASCGDYSVLWNFRRVKAQKPTVISHGAFTVCSHYVLIAKGERVVENAFLHDKYAVAPQAKNALIVATQNKVWNYRDDDEDSNFGDA